MHNGGGWTTRYLPVPPLLALAWCGCGDFLSLSPAVRFTMPLRINGEPAGEAIVDTGGDYELMLGHDHGLPVVDRREVLIFGGRETVEVVGGFHYAVGGIGMAAESAIVGTPICACNGVGFSFFRKTGVTLRLDFDAVVADFARRPAEDGVILAFEPPPVHLPTFDSAFIDVQVHVEGRESAAKEDGAGLRLRALLDTGAAETLIRRGLIAGAGEDLLGRSAIVVRHEELGAVHVRARLFDNPELPDFILGTNVMGAWASRWYFTFTPDGGRVVAVRRGREPE